MQNKTKTIDPPSSSIFPTLLLYPSAMGSCVYPVCPPRPLQNVDSSESLVWLAACGFVYAILTGLDPHRHPSQISCCCPSHGDCTLMFCRISSFEHFRRSKMGQKVLTIRSQRRTALSLTITKWFCSERSSFK